MSTWVTYAIKVLDTQVGDVKIRFTMGTTIVIKLTKTWRTDQRCDQAASNRSSRKLLRLRPNSSGHECLLNYKSEGETSTETFATSKYRRIRKLRLLILV